MAQLRIQRMQEREGREQQGIASRARRRPDRRRSSGCRIGPTHDQGGAALKQIADAGAPLYPGLTDDAEGALLRDARPHVAAASSPMAIQREGHEGWGYALAGWPADSGRWSGWGNRRFGQQHIGQGGPDAVVTTGSAKGGLHNSRHTTATSFALIAGPAPAEFCLPAVGAENGSRRTCSCGFRVLDGNENYRASGPLAFFQASMPPWMWHAVSRPASCAACTAIAERSPKAQ